MHNGAASQFRSRFRPHGLADVTGTSVLWMLRRAWLKLLSLAGLFAAIAVLIAGHFLTPRYPATTVLALEPPGARLPGDFDSVLASPGPDTATIRTESYILTSRALLKDVVASLDLTKAPDFQAKPDLKLPAPLTAWVNRAGTWLDPRNLNVPPALSPEDTAIDALQDRVSVAIPRNAFVLNITVETRSADLSAQIANTLAQAYLDWQTAGKRAVNSASLSTLTARAEDLRASLENLENQRFTFSSRAEHVDLGAAERLSLRLQNARAKLDRDTESYITLTNQITERSNLASRQGTNANDTENQVAALQASLARAAARVAAQEQEVTQLADQLSAMSLDVIAFQNLEREIEATRALYQSFLAELKETSVELGLETPDAQVLSTAVPRPASFPRLGLMALAGALFGFALGLAHVLLSAKVRETARTPDALKLRSSLPVMGVLHRTASAFGTPLDHLKRDPTSPASEAFRSLRTVVLTQTPPPALVGITSSVQGEGKSTALVGLAEMLADLGKRVVIIEADLRRPGLTPKLSTPAQSTLADHLVAPKRLDLETFGRLSSGMPVLPAGQTGLNPADLLASDAIATVLSEAKALADIVLIDMPPSLVAPDAQLLATQMDLLLFGVRWDHTPLSTVDRALALLRPNSAPIGLVLTQLDPARLRNTGPEAAYAPAVYCGYGVQARGPRFWRNPFRRSA